LPNLQDPRFGGGFVLRGKDAVSSPNIEERPFMFVKLTGADRTPTVINASQVTYVSQVTEGTRIRFGEGRTVTVVEPLEEVMDRLNRTQSFPET